MVWRFQDGILDGLGRFWSAVWNLDIKCGFTCWTFFGDSLRSGCSCTITPILPIFSMFQSQTLIRVAFFPVLADVWFWLCFIPCSPIAWRLASYLQVVRGPYGNRLCFFESIAYGLYIAIKKHVNERWFLDIPVPVSSGFVEKKG